MINTERWEASAGSVVCVWRSHCCKDLLSERVCFFLFLPFNFLTAELPPDYKSFTENMTDLNGFCDLFFGFRIMFIVI